jgi:uncharacterized protein (UPF0210 family)
MKIRSITYFFDPGWPLDEAKFKLADEFLKDARKRFQENQYEVQTTRLATTPYSETLGKRIGETPQLAETIEARLKDIDASYASLGPASPNVPGSYEVIPEALARTENIFFSGQMADVRNGISLEAVQACAEVIVRSAPLTPDGFANLRFAALANVPAGTPFFPASYQQGTQSAFALAVEAADLAVEAFTGVENLEQGRDSLVERVGRHGQKLAEISAMLEHKHKIKFGGIDFSLAPFPQEARSLGTAFERMGVPAVGQHGSLAAAAILTESIGRAKFPRTGFSGLMLPVLEDATLARRAAEGTLSVKDLLLYSAVCGTGLDTVPLPGDITVDQIRAVLLDLCALSLRLDKPLTARLMPIPGKQAGDPTGFDFDFFANSKVMPLDAGPLKGVLGGQETFSLKKR